VDKKSRDLLGLRFQLLREGVCRDLFPFEMVPKKEETPINTSVLPFGKRGEKTRNFHAKKCWCLCE